MKDIYIKSVKELRGALKTNKDITIDEWNHYAKNNNLLSGITLIARNNEDSWENLKINCINRRRKIFRIISKSINKMTPVK